MEQLVGRVTALEQRFSAVEQQVTRLAAQLDGYAPVRVVQDMLQPLREATIRMEVTIANLGKRVDTVFDLHEQLLHERARMEKEAMAEKLVLAQKLNEEKIAALKDASLWHILREKWLPILTLIGALYALFVMLHKVFAKWGL